jgi:transcriptional regulator with XRE-family HTH domain
MPKRIAFNNNRKRHFIKQWRKFRGLTLERLAARLDTSPASLSRIENSEQPYTQDFLEAVAEALSTEPASLIMRDPLMDEAMWSLWDRAKPAERQQIENVVRALLKTG